jgi:hypothetical protein
MEVTKKEEQRENKEVKRPEIDPAIIKELMKDFEQGPLRKKIPAIARVLAQSMGTSHPVFRLSQRNPKDHLHDQRDRKFAITQGAQNQGPFS